MRPGGGARTCGGHACGREGTACACGGARMRTHGRCMREHGGCMRAHGCCMRENAPACARVQARMTRGAWRSACMQAAGQRAPAVQITTTCRARAARRQVAALEVALKANADAVTLANLMPSRWAAFIRNSPIEEVKPLGTTARI